MATLSRHTCLLSHSQDIEFGVAPDLERTTTDPFRAHAIFRMMIVSCTPLGQRSPLVQLSAPIPLAAELASNQGPSALPNPSASEVMEPPLKRLCPDTSTSVFDAPIPAADATDTHTNAQPLAVSVDLLLTRAEQFGIDAAWLCEYGSPQTAALASFLIEAATNFQRGFPRIAAHCLARPKIASGNDKSSAPEAHASVSLIKNVVLPKSILTAKTTFVAQEAAFGALLRLDPYTAVEKKVPTAREAGPEHRLMSKFELSNMLGDTKPSTLPGVRVGTALHFQMLFNSSKGLLELDEIPCVYENGEYAAIAVLTAFGDAKKTKGVPCFKPMCMINRDNTTTKATFDAGGLPMIPLAGNPNQGNINCPNDLTSGESVFLVKCMEGDQHVGSFLFGVISHPGHAERNPSELQTAMRAQLLHNLLIGRVTRCETLYLYQSDLDTVFAKLGRTVK